MEPDTERMLTLEMLEGKERRGGRLLVVEVLAEREPEEVGTWAPAMLVAARVSICAIACLVRCYSFSWVGGDAVLVV